MKFGISKVKAYLSSLKKLFVSRKNKQLAAGGVALVLVIAAVTTVFLSASKFSDKPVITIPANVVKIGEAVQNETENDETESSAVSQNETEATTFISKEEKDTFRVDKNIGKVDTASGDSKKDEDAEGKKPIKDDSMNEKDDPGASIKPPEIPKPVEPTQPPKTTKPVTTKPGTTKPETAAPPEEELTPPAKSEFEYVPLKGLNGWQAAGKDVFYIENGAPVKGDKTLGNVKYYFNNYGARASRVGIDVSSHNGNIDWKKVKASGVDYAIIRVGFRGYGEAGTLKLDANFEKNIKGAEAAGLDVGIYFYSQAITVKEALEEASVTVKYIRGHKIKYPVYFDTEFSGGRADKLNKRDRTEIAVAFCEAVKNEGYTPGIYASKSFYNDNLVFSEFGNYQIWLAHYTEQTNFTRRYEMWQYTSKGSVGGISGNVDVNISYYDYPAKSDMSALGKNIVFVRDEAERDKYLLAEAAVIRYEEKRDSLSKTAAMKAVDGLSDARVKNELNSRIRKVHEIESTRPPTTANAPAADN